MKERLKLLLFSIAFFVFILPRNSYASHMGGGELSYQWVHDSTYQLFFRFYRACESGAMQDNTVTITTCNSCDNTTINTVLNLVSGSNGVGIVRYCPNTPDACANPGSSNFPDYEEFVYSGYITLPFKCNHWTMLYSNCCRNASLVNISSASSQSISVEATLDNLNAQGNTSPFLPRNIQGVCINIPQSISVNGFDINNDSLVYTNVTPKGTGSCGSLSDLTYNAGYSVFNPLSSNGFAFLPNTGQLLFTPTAQGIFQLAVEVDEYRNGQKIGSMMKDFPVIVHGNCSYGPPNISIANLAGGSFSSTPNTIITMPGSTLTFGVFAQGFQTGDSVYLWGGNISTASGSTLTTMSLNSGAFSWTPSIMDVGTHMVSFSAYDSTCSVNYGISENSVFYNIVVLPVSPDGIGCVSGSLGGVMDSSDVGRFIIGLDTFGTIYSHLSNPTAVNNFTLHPDTIQLYIDSTYPIQEAGIMNTLHDASAKVTLFIDYDGSHNFDIPQERVWTAYSQAFINYILSGSITIPSTAIVDSPVVMRLILNNDTSAGAASDSACGFFTSGETEDFIVVFRSAASAVKNLANDARVSFYPNPTKGKFKMNISSSIGVNELRVKVSSVTGQTILNKSYGNTGRQFSTEIDISGAAKGLYFVETEADGKRSVNKIVIE